MSPIASQPPTGAPRLWLNLVPSTTMRMWCGWNSAGQSPSTKQSSPLTTPIWTTMELKAPLVDELITPSILRDLARLSRPKRKATLAALATIEWQHCSDDIFYWLDASRHPTMGPYAYTLDNHPMYNCILCKGS